MDGIHPLDFCLQCARKYDIPWKLILNCANGAQGDWLLKNYGELTNKLKQPISFVPTILLNQVSTFVL